MSKKDSVTLLYHFEQMMKAERRRQRELRMTDAAAIATALAAKDLAVAAALAAQEKDVSKTALSNERRFENTNEWRQTYGDLANKGLGATQLVSFVVGAGGVVIAAITLLNH